MYYQSHERSENVGERTYLDNASTTYPKPPCVPQAVVDYMTNAGTNIGRGEYSSAFDVEDLVFDARERLARLFGASDPSQVVFTRNVTEALNLVLKGFLKPGDHVIVSSMEHNAVMRPLTQLAERGVRFSRASCAADGSLDPNDIEKLIEPQTKLVVMTHASNVCGTVLPAREIARICREHGIRFVLDAAQSAGVIPIEAQKWGVDAVCFTGHKGLLGPQGTGGVVFTGDFASAIDSLVAGGTGSSSDLEEMPDFMPDHLEAGTPNLPGIAGLRASLEWLEERGIDAIRDHELALTGRFLEGLEPMEERGLLRIVGKKTLEGRTGVVSIQTPDHELAEVAHALDARYGIQTRVGLHCAPSAHRTLGTFPTGTIRFSFGWANTEKDVDLALKALRELLGALN